MNISNRLKLIASYTKGYDVVADIGTDHGYMVCYSILEGYTKKGIASDIEQGPIENAIKNIKKYNLEDKIKAIKAPGLEGIKEDVDCIVIAGMGGMLIKSILEDSIDLVKKSKRLILQPNVGAKAIRKWCVINDFKISEEIIIEENKKIYEILVIEHGNVTYTEDEINYGPFLLKEKSSLFIKKYTNELQKIEMISKNIPSDKLKDTEIYHELISLRKLINE